MGLFDLVDDALDAAVDLPGKIIEKGAEAVTRIPEAGIKAVKGAIKGVEKGVEKLEDAVDD